MLQCCLRMICVSLCWMLFNISAYAQEASYTLPVYRGLNFVAVKAMAATTGIKMASDLARAMDAKFVARLVPRSAGERSRFEVFVQGLGARDFAIERGSSIAYMVSSTSERVIEIDTRIPISQPTDGTPPTTEPAPGGTFTLASGNIVLIRDPSFSWQETLLTVLNPATGAVIGQHTVAGFVAHHLDRKYLYASQSMECQGRGIIAYDYTTGRQTRITNSGSATAEHQCDSMVDDVSPVPQPNGTVAFVRGRTRTPSFQTGFSIYETSDAGWTEIWWWTEDTLGVRYSFPIGFRSGPRVYALYEETILSPQGTISGYQKPQITVITGPFASSVLTSFAGGVLSYDVNAAGTKIVLAAKESASSDAEIYTMDQDGGGLAQLTDNSVDDRSPVFSKDQTKIIFVSQRETDGAVHDMQVDGSGSRLLYRPPFGEGGFLRIVP